MPAFWTNPIPRPSMGEEQAGTQIQFPNITGLVQAITQQQEQQRREIQQTAKQAISGVQDYMDRKRTDEVAKTILGHAGYQGYDEDGNMLGDPLARQLMESDARPTEALSAWHQIRQENLQEQLRQAQIGHYNAMSEHARASTGTGVGAVPTSPTIDQKTGMIWNGHQWVLGPKTHGPTADPLDEEMKKRFGVSRERILDAVNAGRAQQIDPSTGKPLADPQGNPLSQMALSKLPVKDEDVLKIPLSGGHSAVASRADLAPYLQHTGPDNSGPMPPISKLEGQVVIQKGQRYRVTNGVPIPIP